MQQKHYRRWRPEWDAQQDEESRLLEALFAKIADSMQLSLSLSEALAWLKQKGWQTEDGSRAGGEASVMGLEAIVQSLRSRRHEMLRRYDMQGLVKRIQERMQRIIALELATARELLGEIHPQFLRRQDHLLSAPVALGEAFAHLGAYVETFDGFLDDEAARLWRILSDELKRSAPPNRAGNELESSAAESSRMRSSEMPLSATPASPGPEQELSRLETFVRRHGGQFRGAQIPSFAEGTQLMRHFTEGRTLIEALQSGRLSPELSLHPALNAEQHRALELLSRLEIEMQNRGWIRQKQRREERQEGASNAEEQHDADWELSRRGAQKMGRLALKAIFSHFSQPQAARLWGTHRTARRGSGETDFAASHPYHRGETLHFDWTTTLKHCLQREALRKPPWRVGDPLTLRREDVHTYEADTSCRAVTVLLLDLSWSMSREGRFPAAKQIAVALQELMRTTYPRDHYYTIGFSTRARQFSEREFTEARWDPSDPFTNLQEALLLARQLCRNHAYTSRQVLVITDGQPTAIHVRGQTNAQWPGMSGRIPPRIHAETLKEVNACTREGLTLNVFMLDDNPLLVNFIERVVRINRGRAFHSNPYELGASLLVDYLTPNKTRRRWIR